MGGGRRYSACFSIFAPLLGLHPHPRLCFKARFSIRAPPRRRPRPAPFRPVARRVAVALRAREFDRLILAGPEEPTSELRRLLPRALAQRLVAVIPAEVFASDAEILAKTLEVERQMERELEDGLLEELFEIAGA